jgi:hypothetical protein
MIEQCKPYEGVSAQIRARAVPGFTAFGSICANPIEVARTLWVPTS